MRHLSDKLLAVVLALLLGLTPLQGAIAAALGVAGCDAHQEQQAGAHHTSGDSDALASAHHATKQDGSAHDCSDCASDGCCFTGMSCGTSHCSSTAAPLVVESIVSLSSFGQSYNASAPDAVLASEPAVLYRPPRA